MPRSRKNAASVALASASASEDPVRLVLRQNPSGSGLDTDTVQQLAREATSHLESLQSAADACHASFTHASLQRVEAAAGDVRQSVVKLRGLCAYAKARDPTTFRIATSQLESVQKRYLHILGSLPSASPFPGRSPELARQISLTSLPYAQQQQTSQQRQTEQQRRQYDDVVERTQEIQAVEADMLRLNALFQEVQQMTEVQGELLDFVDENIDATNVETVKAYQKLSRAKRFKDKVSRNKKIVGVAVAVVVVVGVVILVVVLL